MRNREVFLRLTTVLLLIAASACGKPFNIRPIAAVKAPDYEAASTVDRVLVNGVALTDEDFLYETFNANLILAGVLPVRLKLTNAGPTEINFRRNWFELRAGDRRLKSIEAKRAFKRMLSFYGVRIYNKIGYEQSRTALRSYELDFGAPLKPGASRDGIVFFEARPPVERDVALVLLAKGLGGSDSRKLLELRLK